MNTIRKSNITYWILVVILAALSGVTVLFQQQLLPGDVSMPVSKPVLALANMAIVLVVYGGLG